jgi:hypothetical protein
MLYVWYSDDVLMVIKYVILNSTWTCSRYMCEVVDFQEDSCGDGL